MLGLLKTGFKLLTGGPAGVIGDLVGSFTDGIKAKRDLKREIELKKLERVQKLDTADVEWDRLMAEASGQSWKDEFWTIILALPFVLIFVPSLQGYIEAGFVALEASTPEWYRYALLTAIGAAFGVSQLRKFKR